MSIFVKGKLGNLQLQCLCRTGEVSLTTLPSLLTVVKTTATTSSFEFLSSYARVRSAESQQQESVQGFQGKMPNSKFWIDGTALVRGRPQQKDRSPSCKKCGSSSSLIDRNWCCHPIESGLILSSFSSCWIDIIATISTLQILLLNFGFKM